MGNKWVESETPQVSIDGRPNKHVLLGESGLTITPSIGRSVRILVGGSSASWAEKPIGSNGDYTEFSIDFLPDPNVESPGLVNIKDALRESFATLFEENPSLDEIINKGDSVIIDHGSALGLVPEEVMIEILNEKGVKVVSGIGKVGGRNRNQQHSICLDKGEGHVHFPKPETTTLYTRVQKMWQGFWRGKST